MNANKKLLTALHKDKTLLVIFSGIIFSGIALAGLLTIISIWYL